GSDLRNASINLVTRWRYLQHTQALGDLVRHGVQAFTAYRQPTEAAKQRGSRPRSWHRPLYAFRGGLSGAGASSTDAKIAANIERGFCPKKRSAAVVPSGRVRKKL